MSTWSQIGAVSAINIRSLRSRIGPSSVVVVGIAGVVAVLISVLAMSTGLIKALEPKGSDHRAIVVRTGANAEIVSVLTNEEAQAIVDSAGIEKGANGGALASPEVLMSFNLFRRDHVEANVPFRGMEPGGFAVHSEIRITGGRIFRAGMTELLVGASAQRLYSGLSLGSVIKLRGTPWTVVGTFECGHCARESELIADAQTLNSVYRRGSVFQSVFVVIDPRAGFQVFKDAITTNPALKVDVATEQEFGSQESENTNRILSVVAYVVGGIMAVGAIFGALNTLYSAVSARSREIATLRAIGFGPVPLVVSVFVEALLLALTGGAVGASIAWLLFNGHSVNSVGGDMGGQLIFDLAVTPGLMTLGIAWACLIGLIGGLFPAVRAARLPIATALRAG